MFQSVLQYLEAINYKPYFMEKTHDTGMRHSLPNTDRLVNSRICCTTTSGWDEEKIEHVWSTLLKDCSTGNKDQSRLSWQQKRITGRWFSLPFQNYFQWSLCWGTPLFFYTYDQMGYGSQMGNPKLNGQTPQMTKIWGPIFWIEYAWILSPNIWLNHNH